MTRWIKSEPTKAELFRRRDKKLTRAISLLMKGVGAEELDLGNSHVGFWAFLRETRIANDAILIRIFSLASSEANRTNKYFFVYSSRDSNRTKVYVAVSDMGPVKKGNPRFRNVGRMEASDFLGLSNTNPGSVEELLRPFEILPYWLPDRPEFGQDSSGEVLRDILWPGGRS